MTDRQAITAMYFGVIAASPTAANGGMGLADCWKRAEDLATFALGRLNGTQSPAHVRVPSEG